jgi:hypothetical protein
MTEQQPNNFETQAPPPAGDDAGQAQLNFIYKRPVAPVTFGLIVLMFFFTFIDIKCNGVSLGTVKGYELATGYHVGKGSGDETKHKDPNVYAAMALLLAALGCGLSFLRARPGSLAKLICGAAGFLSMVILYLSLKQDAHQANADSMSSSIKISIDFQLAFWIALGLFLFATILGILSLRKKIPGG